MSLFQYEDISISQDGASMALTSNSNGNDADNVVRQEPNLRRSWIYSNNFARREQRNGINFVVCQVRQCKQAYISKDFSTSNIRRHLKNRHNVTEGDAFYSNDDQSIGPMDSFVVDGQLATGQRYVEVTRESWREQLSRFLITSQSAFSIVENVEFRELLRMTQQATQRSVTDPISADTIKRDIETLYNENKENIKRILQQQVSLSFTLDMWTSEWGADFLGITVHFIDHNWVQQEVLIGFEHPKGRHTGEELAELFLNVLDSFGITSLLFTITTDGGSNILKMAAELEAIAITRGDFTFRKELQHIPCVGHVANLAVQIALREGLRCEPVNDSDEEIDENESIVSKIRTGIKKIRRSTGKYRKQYAEFCRILFNDVKELRLDVKTRWNSTMMMVERVLEVRQAYNRTCLFFPELERYTLLDSDIVFLEKVKKLLGQFKDMTEAVSSSRYPSVNVVVFAYNALMDAIEDFCDDNTNPEQVKEAAAKAQEKLAQYYSRTDSTNVYAIATSLDPRLKFRYWEEQEWENVYIRDARSKVTLEWEKYSDNALILSSHEATRDNQGNRFRPKRQRVVDELQAYVDGPLLSTTGAEDEENCELYYWRHVGCTMYPRLSMMARRYLSVPATSTSCERLFSKAKHFIPASRNRMLPETLKQSILLDSWINFYKNNKPMSFSSWLISNVY